MWRNCGSRVYFVHVSSARVLNIFPPPAKGSVRRATYLGERGLGGYGFSVSQTFIISVLSTHLDYNDSSDSAMVWRISRALSLLGVLGKDFPSVRSRGFVDVHVISVRYQEVKGRGGEVQHINSTSRITCAKGCIEDVGKRHHQIVAGLACQELRREGIA